MFIFRYFKMFGLHAILHEAPGAKKAHSGKHPGYYLKVGRGPKSCLLGHVTGLLSWFYVKFFLPSIFNSLKFCSSMSWFFLDIEFADINVNKELGVLNAGIVQGYSFCPPKQYKPTKQSALCTRIFNGILWNSGRWDYGELPNILSRCEKGD